MRLVNGVPVADDPAHAGQQTAGNTFRQGRVPVAITNDQFRRALRNTSTATINSFLTYVSGASADIQDYWQFRYIIRRDHPNVEAARVAIGRTQAQIDTFFRNAKRLT